MSCSWYPDYLCSVPAGADLAGYGTTNAYHAAMKKDEAIYEEIDVDRRFVRINVARSLGNPGYGVLGPAEPIYMTVCVLTWHQS